MELHVLLVEDDANDRRQLMRDLPEIFAAKDISVRLDDKSTFEEGMDAAKDTIVRYDLVISDAYRGPVADGDAAVMAMIDEYKSGKFCPLIIISNGECPAELSSTAFVRWVSKVDPKDLEAAVHELLDLGIPQLAKSLHEQIDSSAGNFLWKFVEQNWENLADRVKNDPKLLDRLIRRRAALMISDLMPATYSAVGKRYGLEYYVYPALDHDYYSLGDILRNKKKETEFRVVMTPHCYLFTQENQTRPRAEYVLTINTVLAKDILSEKVKSARNLDAPAQHDRLRRWSTSPAQIGGKPSGRHWYLPSFLDIPHLFCDFFQIESIKYDDLKSDYESIATLVPPYAEAMQACFLSFYGSVGIPSIDPASIIDIIGGPVTKEPAKKVPPSKKKASKKQRAKRAKTKKSAGKKKAKKKTSRKEG